LHEKNKKWYGTTFKEDIRKAEASLSISVEAVHGKRIYEAYMLKKLLL
jgi:hypothetical protein